MIRMKAKSVLLSIMLILASFCFFACKDTEVKVDSISFTTTSVDMLVGEEFSPEIKILPSYAGNRSYTLISSDVTVLSVDGGTVTALKAGVGIKLKVVSNENPNINDMISINIYNHAVDLETPLNLTFDGTKFSFDAVDNASAYMLKIDGNEINIGNNTEYAFENIVSKLGTEVYDKVLDCSVSAVGDGRIYKNSDYSDDCQFVCLSQIKSPYVNDETLYFNPIANIRQYNVEVFRNGKYIETKLVQNASLQSGQLSLSVANLDASDSVKGAEYEFVISADVLHYQGLDSGRVFASQPVKVAYVVLGQVANLSMNDYVVSWDFVNNAISYDVSLYLKNGSLVSGYPKINITNNYLKLQGLASGEYYVNVIAKNPLGSVTNGKLNSSNFVFKVLSNTAINIQSNTLTWNDVQDAEGYVITIKTDDANVIVNKNFTLQTSYDVSNFSAGDYQVQVQVCGNSYTALNCLDIATDSWHVLKDVSEVEIKNKKLIWKDGDAGSNNKYRLMISVDGENDVDVLLTNSDLGAQYSFDATNKTYSFDLSVYNFTVGQHNITLQNVGNGLKVFDAELVETQLFKLDDAAINSISNKNVSISPVTNGVKYEMGLFSADDVEFVSPISKIAVTGNKYLLNDDEIDAGNYVLKLYVYGNDKEIFDANNVSVDTMLNFEKLATPNILINAEDLYVEVEQNIANAEGYKLYQNGMEVVLQDGKYDISNLTAGDYCYQAIAVGNNQDILNSYKTSTENSKNVKKLKNPSLEFDKNNLTYTVSSTDNDVEFEFKLDDENITVVDGVVDLSSKIIAAGEYQVQVLTLAENIVGFDLIISPNIVNDSVTKLQGGADVKVSNGKLILTPKTQLVGLGYSISVKVENQDNEYIVIDSSKYVVPQDTSVDPYFEIDLYNAQYDVVEFKNAEGVTFFDKAESYNVYTTILNSNEHVVSSNEVQCDDIITVLDKVNNISRSSQNIKFNTIEDATDYILRIEVEGSVKYIDIAGKYTTDTKNTLALSDLLDLMEQNNVEYKAKTKYTISFVSVSSNELYVMNKSDFTFDFEFLDAPKIGVTEQGDQKLLTIANDIEHATSYIVKFVQGETEKEIVINVADEYCKYDFALLSGFSAGKIDVSVKAKASTGAYFESKTADLSVKKLASTVVEVENGILKWNAVEGAKKYNLHYMQSGDKVVSLNQYSENFKIENGVCYYEFDSLNSGMTNVYMQVDGILSVNGEYCVNSDAGETTENVYKLPTLNIGVVRGNVYTEIKNLDLLKINKIEVLVDNQPVTINLTENSDDVKLNVDLAKTGITIAPTALLKYVSNAVLLPENISIKLYSNSDNVLNSSVASKNVYGLLAPVGLDIVTSTTLDDNSCIQEVLEKITWTNPNANGEHVSVYKVVITYNDEDYIYTTTNTALMMPEYDDANSNGEFDDGEVKFGAGQYTIKVMALTDNSDDIVSSKYSEEMIVTILNTPTNLSTNQGNIQWSDDAYPEYYIVRTYLVESDGTRTLISSCESNTNKIDMTTLSPFDTGVYGITVQAMHSASKILVSEESEVFEVVRLPHAKGYFIKDGELYIRAHKFYTSAEITLVDEATGLNSYLFVLSNNDLIAYDVFMAINTSWSTSNILDTYLDDDYYQDYLYKNIGDDTTLLKALAEGYTVNIKLIGNTCNGKGGIISGYDLLNAENLNFDSDELVKLATPIVKVSEDARGQIELALPTTLTYNSLEYYKIDENALRGVQLFEVHIQADKQYSFYVADIIDEDAFAASGAVVIEEEEAKHFLKYFVWGEKYFNVLAELKFDFANDYYYYYNADGVYSHIYLVNGGSFIMNARMLGDDTCFAQSNISKDAVIKRYSVLNVTANNGMLTWLNQADEYDHPVYMITVENNNNKYEIIVYNKNVYSKEQIQNYLDPDSIKNYYYDEIIYSLEDKVITYSNMANVLAECKGDALGGTYTISIMTYFTDESSNSKLLAQSVIPKTITVLPEVNIGLNNGVLTWNLVYVEKTGGGEYITNYLLQILDENGDALHDIVLHAGDYNVKNSMARYELGDYGDDFAFVDGNNYKFNIKALGGISNTYINSKVKVTDTYNLLPKLSNLRMENGVLTWNNPTTNSVDIYMSYMLGDNLVIYTTSTTGSSFDLPIEAVYDINGISRTFIAGNDYFISVRIRGTNTSLSGYYVTIVDENGDAKPIHRLNNISQYITQEDQIATWIEDGKLRWAESSVENVKYNVYYTLSDGSTGVSDILTTNEFDFASLLEGEISVRIEAHHNDYFKSFKTSAISVFKLSMPENIVFNDGTTTISWDNVVDNNEQVISNYKVKIQQEGAEDQEFICNTSSWVIEGVVGVSFKIAVSAISLGAETNFINSDYTDFIEMVQPNSVDRTTFVYNDELNRFEWKAIENEQTGDKYFIGYDFYKVGQDMPESSTNYPAEEVSEWEIIDSEKYYYYYPREIGTYRQIYVQVLRAGSLSSLATYCTSEQGSYVLEFNLFANGDGSNSNPYIITTETHLRNIKFFLNANYELQDNVNLISSQPITDETQVFTGKITANNDYFISGYTIGGYNNEILEKTLLSNYIGLFNKAQNATFENINLTGFNIHGYLGSSSLKAGLLVGEAENCTFTNVKAVSSSVSIVKDDTFGYGGRNYNIYLGGLVGYGQNCTFENCQISFVSSDRNIYIYAKGYNTSVINIGGLAGYMNAGVIEDCEVAFNITDQLVAAQSSKPTMNLGGCVGLAYDNQVTLQNNTVNINEIQITVSGITDNEIIELIGKYQN